MEKSHAKILNKLNEIQHDIIKHHIKHGPHGEGFGDDFVNAFKNLGHTIKSGFEDKIEKPIVNTYHKIEPVLQKGVESVGSYMTKKKGGLASDLLHNGVPALTSALGGAAGTLLAPELGPLGGIAGSTLGGFAGREIADKVGNKTGTGLRKKRKHRKYYPESDSDIEVDKKRESALEQLLKAHNKKEEKELMKGNLELIRHLHEEMKDIRGGRPLRHIGSGISGCGEIHHGAIMRTRGTGFKKGSKEAKEHMARIRAMRKK